MYCGHLVNPCCHSYADNRRPYSQRSHSSAWADASALWDRKKRPRALMSRAAFVADDVTAHDEGLASSCCRPRRAGCGVGWVMGNVGLGHTSVPIARKLGVVCGWRPEARTGQGLMRNRDMRVERGRAAGPCCQPIILAGRLKAAKVRNMLCSRRCSPPEENTRANALSDLQSGEWRPSRSGRVGRPKIGPRAELTMSERNLGAILPMRCNADPLPPVSQFIEITFSRRSHCGGAAGKDYSWELEKPARGQCDVTA